MTITVLGLGPMGRAMTRVFLTNGHRVTVWNRTASKAAELTEAGARLAGAPAEAVAASELVVLSLTDYQVMYDILGTAGEALSGRVIVNLTSDTPQRSREAADWLAERGASLIAGGVMVPEAVVGTEHSFIYFSGPEADFRAHEPTLRLLGTPDYLGTDPALAQLFYQAQMHMFLTALSAYLHSTALVGAAGITAGEFLPHAQRFADTFSSFLGEGARNIEAGTHPGELANAIMMGATAEHIEHTCEQSGVDTALAGVVRAQYRRLIDSGNGTQSWTGIYELIKG